jgi:hypothetical protein
MSINRYKTIKIKSRWERMSRKAMVLRAEA